MSKSKYQMQLINFFLHRLDTLEEQMKTDKSYVLLGQINELKFVLDKLENPVE